MPKVYPVIHYKDDKTTIEQAKIAYKLGAKGVFLISHIGKNENLIPLATTIKNELDNFKVGLNFLGDDILYTAQVVKENNLDMLWGDDCGVSSRGLNYTGENLSQWALENRKILVFASVAFKYQKTEINPALAAKEALNAGFVPTTSGAGTGQAPTVEKIQIMSSVTEGLLAVASGMDCDNVIQFKDYLSHILVSTRVSKDDYHFDEEKLARFIELAKS
jgi:hypothetical protein